MRLKIWETRKKYFHDNFIKRTEYLGVMICSKCGEKGYGQRSIWIHKITGKIYPMKDLCRHKTNNKYSHSCWDVMPSYSFLSV